MTSCAIHVDGVNEQAYQVQQLHGALQRLSPPQLQPLRQLHTHTSLKHQPAGPHNSKDTSAATVSYITQCMLDWVGWSDRTAGPSGGFELRYRLSESHEHTTSLPCLAQVISLVGWPKLVRFFFFFSFFFFKGMLKQ